MNGGLLAVVAVVVPVLLVATVWIVLTRGGRTRSGEEPQSASGEERQSAVVWRRPVSHRIAHAFWKVDVEIEVHFFAKPLASCGQWLVVELVRDDQAERCLPCVHAAQRAVR